jgi:hypothetical protein
MEYYFSYHVRRNKCTVFKKLCRPSPDAPLARISPKEVLGTRSDRSLWAIDSRFSLSVRFTTRIGRFSSSTEPLSAVGGHRPRALL